MVNMGHDVDFVMMYQMLMVDVNLMDELEMLNNVQWNVDDDIQDSSDDNQLMLIETIRRHLNVAAEKQKQHTN